VLSRYSKPCSHGWDSMTRYRGGGADGSHPGADPDWVAATYMYRNKNLEWMWTSAQPTNLIMALEHCDFVEEICEPAESVHYIERKIAGESGYTLVWSLERGFVDEPVESEVPGSVPEG
jgi:hypothetical protein